MKQRFEVVVSLKPGLLDPQGAAIEGSLPAMGWTNVTDVRLGKHVWLTLDAENEASAREQVEQIARRLLSNPVIEAFDILRPRDAGS
jgi:phosphoribosylformylglycinamidine synthase subunit PurS